VNPKPENNLPAGFITPIIALEFIQSPQEVARFFEVSDVAAYVQDLNLGQFHRLSFYVFIQQLIVFYCTWYLPHYTSKNDVYSYVVLLFYADFLTDWKTCRLHQIVQLYKTGDITPNFRFVKYFHLVEMEFHCFLFPVVFSFPFLKEK
jgi:hypothetical protein